MNTAERLLVASALVLAPVAAGCASVTAAGTAPVFSGTPDPTSDTFLVLGDSRPGFLVEPGPQLDPAGHIEMAERMRDEHPAFVVHTGDIARVGGLASQWEIFDRDFAPLRDAGIALWPVFGNHEYIGDDAAGRANYFARFPWLDGHDAYVRDWRGLRFLLFDSNTDALGADGVRRTRDWLAAQLERADADDDVRAVLLVCHHPPYSNRIRPGESDWVRDVVVPLAAEYPKARALFVGHVHSYEHFYEGGLQTIVTGGGGSPLHELLEPGRPGTRPDLYDGDRGFHYCRVRVGARIEVEVVLRRAPGRWEVVDRFDI